MKLREAEAIMGLKELRQQVRDLEEHWQVCQDSRFLKGAKTTILSLCEFEVAGDEESCFVS